MVQQEHYQWAVRSAAAVFGDASRALTQCRRVPKSIWGSTCPEIHGTAVQLWIPSSAETRKCGYVLCRLLRLLSACSALHRLCCFSSVGCSNVVDVCMFRLGAKFILTTPNHRVGPSSSHTPHTSSLPSSDAQVRTEMPRDNCCGKRNVCITARCGCGAGLERGQVARILPIKEEKTSRGWCAIRSSSTHIPYFCTAVKREESV